MNTTKGKISELEDMSIETSKVEKLKKKKTEILIEYTRTMGSLQRVQRIDEKSTKRKKMIWENDD